jgi:type IV pilus assembly protein PilQ
MRIARICILIILFTSFLAAQEEKKQPLVTNTFVMTDIKEALLDVSEMVGIPIIVDESVYGEVTVDLKDVPLEKALDMILTAGGFVYKKMDGYYLVSAGKPDIATFPLIAEVEYIKPKYLKADEIKRLLTPFYDEYIAYDEKKNMLIVTAPRRLINKIKQDIEVIDKPQRQIVIEALVTEVTEDIARELGISWDKFDLTAELTGNVISFKKIKEEKSEIKYSILAKLLPYINEGKVKLKATPRVTTADGQEASISITQSEYYPIEAERFARLESISTGISLRIRPFISEVGIITMEIQPDVSTIIGIKKVKDTDYPIVGRRSIHTQVRVKDGETIAIGGLSHTSEKKTKSRIIPILSKIPPFSWFLGKSEASVSTKELVIFVTPHILPE